MAKLATYALLFSIGCTMPGESFERSWQKAISDLDSRSIVTRRAAADALISIASAPLYRARSEAEKLVIRRDLDTLASIVADPGEDQTVREHLIRAMGELGEIAEPAAPSLIQVLVSEHEPPVVRGWIAMILPEIAPPDRIREPLRYAARSHDTTVRVNAAQSFSRILVDQDESLTWATEAIRDSAPQVRILAAGISARMSEHDDRFLPILVRALADENKQVSFAALAALNTWDTAGINMIAILEDMLETSDVTTKVHAASALTTLTDDGEEYIHIILTALEHENARVRAEAAQALTGCEGCDRGRVRRALQEALADEDELVRLHAAFVLSSGRMPEPDHVAILVRGLESERADVQFWSALYVRIVAQHAPSIIAPFLVQSTENRSAFARSVAMSLIVGLPVDKEAKLALFARGLDDDTTAVRVASLGGLALLGTNATSVVPKVKELLDAEDPEVRMFARSALSAISEVE